MFLTQPLLGNLNGIGESLGSWRIYWKLENLLGLGESLGSWMLLLGVGCFTWVSDAELYMQCCTLNDYAILCSTLYEYEILAIRYKTTFVMFLQPPLRCRWRCEWEGLAMSPRLSSTSLDVAGDVHRVIVQYTIRIRDTCNTLYDYVPLCF